MARKILRAGYYWLTMESDCCLHVRKCHKCQTFADNVNTLPLPLNVLATPWPFSMWGIDVIGAIEPKAANRHRFILVVIDYFTKWVEAASYASVTRSVVVRFVKREIICRYGLPRKIITDNGTNLNNKMMGEMCEEFKIQHHNSTPCRPKMNGAVEATNKNIKKIIHEMIVSYKDWHGRLYQKRVKNAFDKKVRSRRFSEGDLVLKKVSQALKDNRGKWAPNYEDLSL